MARTAQTLPRPGAGRRAGARHRGFSFVELLIVTVMLGLLAAIAVPAILGQRERAEDATAKSLLRAGAGAVEASFTQEESYAGLDAAALRAVEPNVKWLDAPGAQSAETEVSLSNVGEDTFTLTTTTRAGTVYTYKKDLGATPVVSRTCGAGCTW
ncbi:MAG: prepilin-type N-terminal cleavage/methylation domain-containing protein [Actinomycetota bacterium]